MENTEYQETARRIVELVGRDNIVSATHCATRLRLIVKDKEAINEKSWKQYRWSKEPSLMPDNTRLYWEQVLLIKSMQRLSR